jgi:uncharacterized membrane protein YkgB
MLLWFAAMAWLPGLDSGAGRWLKALAIGLPPVEVSRGIALLQALAALLLLNARTRQAGGALVALLYFGSLGLLLTPTAWISTLGGFPAIGAGQGLLKHLSIGALGLALLPRWREPALVLARLGVVLVLVWIGGMKFTQLEADAIVPLMQSQPWLAWPYRFASSLQVSMAIGVIEIATAALLLAPANGWRRLGTRLALVTFAVTLSFLFSAPGWAEGWPPGVLDSGGRFLAKDLLLALTLLLQHPEESLARASSPVS